jgi:hypothetical protein
MKGDEKPTLFDNGVWELVSEIGQFVGKRGVDSLVMKPQGGELVYPGGRGWRQGLMSPNVAPASQKISMVYAQ